MKRLTKYLLPFCMALMVTAAPSVSFAGQPGEYAEGKDVYTYRDLKQMVQVAKDLCDHAKNGDWDLSEIMSHIVQGACGQPGELPIWPEWPDNDQEQPGDDENQPGDDENQPGDDENQPGDDENQPGDDENQPGDDENQPGDDENQPGDDENQPGDDENQPGDDENQPGDDENQPGDDQIKPDQPDQPEEDNDQDQDESIGTYQSQVVALVNQERAKQGLSALKINTSLSKVATAKAEDMRDKGYFSHTSPTYGSPFDMMKQFGIQYASAGENIAKGQKTPASVMNDWMNSQGHRENIMNSSYTEIGVGYVTDANGGTYWVQMFIRP